MNNESKQTPQVTPATIDPKVEVKKVVIKSAIRAGQGGNRYSMR